MWLERFAVQSRDATPSPQPRRSNTLTRRPGLQPRSSSLSIASLNASTDSLPPAARVAPGSNLKTQLAGANTSDLPKPLDVLHGIIGPIKERASENGHTEEVNAQRPAAIDADIDFGSLSLEEFAHAPVSTAASATPATNGATIVLADYEKEKDRFENLHQSILACDEVLKSVETYLTSFRADLAAVSSEIESLQDRSTTLNNKLQNRKTVERVLGPEVEALTVAPAVVRKITEGTVDEQWVKAVQELEKRSRAIDAKMGEDKDIKAAQDIRPFIKDVSDRAVERTRDYIVSQIRALRSPGINALVIQQESFLPYRDVFAFLGKAQPRLAEDVSQAYMNTIRWYYLHNFGRYKASIEKLNLHTIDYTDVIAGESGGKRPGRMGASHDVLSLGRRNDILHTVNDAAMPSFAAEEDKGTHCLEVPFRAFTWALVDNASAEYSFLTEFFVRESQQAKNRKFNEIFQPTFELGRALTKQLIDQSFDALGILICIRLIQRVAFELQRRKTPVVEGYINGTSMLLWPRFQVVVDAHCDSIRKATAALPGKPSGSALSLTSSSSSSSAQTTAPHMLTQRFANFLSGILTLSSEGGDDEPVAKSVGRLRADFDAFLLKLSKGVADARKRERFLFNNYSLIGTIIADTTGKLAEELKGHFADQRDALHVE